MNALIPSAAPAVPCCLSTGAVLAHASVAVRSGDDPWHLVQDEGDTDRFMGMNLPGVSLAECYAFMDIGSPLLQLTRLSFAHARDYGDDHLRIEGAYRVDGEPIDDTSYQVSLAVIDGGLRVKGRSLTLHENLQRLGFGTRSLLGLLLFARRHELTGFYDTAVEQGILVWPRLGGTVTDATDADEVIVYYETAEALRFLTRTSIPRSVRKKAKRLAAGYATAGEDLALAGLVQAWRAAVAELGGRPGMPRRKAASVRPTPPRHARVRGAGI